MTDQRTSYDYPHFEGLYISALRDVADRRLTPTEREAAARLVAFLLHEKEATEAVATDVLAAAERAFDAPMAVLTLMRGLRDTRDEHQQVAVGAARLANLALKAGEREAFLVLVHFLVGLDSWEGTSRPLGVSPSFAPRAIGFSVTASPARAQRTVVGLV